jgi:hypothetical protein
MSRGGSPLPPPVTLPKPKIISETEDKSSSSSSSNERKKHQLNAEHRNIFYQLDEIRQELKRLNHQQNDANKYTTSHSTTFGHDNTRIIDKPVLLVEDLSTDGDKRYGDIATQTDRDDVSTDLYIPDLSLIIEALRDSNFDDTKWMSLGLTLGLFITTLKVIENDHWMDTPRCLLETLDKWLRRADNVSNEGNPSWDTLSGALRKMSEQASADYITEHEITYEASILNNNKSRDAALVDVVKDASKSLLDQNKKQIEGLVEKMELVTLQSHEGISHKLIEEMNVEIQQLNKMNEVKLTNQIIE